MKLSAVAETRKFGPYLEAGYKYMDISFCATIYEGDLHDPILDSDDWLEHIDALKKQYDEQGIQIVTTHLPFRYNFTDHTTADYAAKYEMTRRSLIASEHLGARWAVVHIRSVEGTIAHVKKLFADTGVKAIGIAIENIFNVPMENLIEAHDALKAEGYDVGICLDMGHCHMTTHYTYDIVETIYRLGSRIQMLHVHDNCQNGDHHRVPFAGTIPWDDCMRALKDVGYTGKLNYELNLRILPPSLVDPYIKYSVQVAQYLSSVYDAHIPANKEGAK